MTAEETSQAPLVLPPKPGMSLLMKLGIALLAVAVLVVGAWAYGRSSTAPARAAIAWACASPGCAGGWAWGSDAPSIPDTAAISRAIRTTMEARFTLVPSPRATSASRAPRAA